MKKPHLIYRFLESLLPPDVHHLIGDLEEEFHFTIERDGKARARLHFWSQLLQSAPLFFFQSLIWNSEMLLNYLKITWRNFKKNTSFSLINIIGLSASMSVCLLIMLFLIDQKSDDQFHDNADRIVRVISDFKSPASGYSNEFATSPHELSGIIEEKLPSVERALPIRGNFSGEFRKNGITIQLAGFYASESFFSFFDFELSKGNPKTALINPGSVILTQESAERLFGEENPLGKSITGLGDREYTVTGVIDKEYRTHFNLEAIASHSTLLANPEEEKRLKIWNSSIYDSYTYLLLKKGTKLDQLDSDLNALIPQHFVDLDQGFILKSLTAQPLTSINLGEELSNEIGIVVPRIIAFFLGGLCLIIMLIAIFNYVSLTIARALNRGKEVGVRKVLGANKSRIIHQFLFESILISITSLLFGILMLRWLLPEFNSLFFISFTSNQVEANLLLNPWTVIIFLNFALTVGVLAGIYPSFYLSRFNPAIILKGTFNVKGVSGQALKKIITVSQFTFSIIFIITSIVLVKQFEFMTTTEYGFEQENIVHIEQQDIPYNQLKDVLKQSSRLSNISVTSTVPALGSIDGANLESDLVDRIVYSHTYYVDENYLAIMGLELLEGRNFNPDRSTDSSNAIILSEEAIHDLGFKTPLEAVGQTITSNDEEISIIGVIKGFITSDPMQKNAPISMFFQPDRSRYIIAKVLPNQTIPFIEELEAQWENTGSAFDIKYRIFDEELKESPILILFLDFIKIISLIGGFSIFISCLGLLGMAMYSAENRVKEIGIRKVLGATEGNIILLLSKEYLVLIIISIGIGIPLAFLFNNLWLESISNKIPLEASFFILGALGSIILALLTIGTQALKAARANSIENLRSE